MKPRELKPETIIANLKRQLRRAEARASNAERERSTLTRSRDAWRDESLEWKRRFDELLSRVPVAALPPVKP